MQLDTDKKVFWAPNISWFIKDSELHIESYNFHGDSAQLFPEFHSICMMGTTLEELVNKFPEYNEFKLRKFVHKLISLNILINRVQSVEELFHGQEKLFQPEEQIDHDYFMNAGNVKRYAAKCLVREAPKSEIGIKLPKYNLLNECFTSRRSVRCFKRDCIISLQQFMSVLSVMDQYLEDGERHYCYPSAGGLYPIDCYLYVKKDRVESVKEGLYYYDPIRRTLNLISDGRSITKDSHYFINKDIFESSAFSMYFMYNATVSMPKYGSRAYYYAILDAGILIGYLNIISTMNGIGQCSIGDMRFSDIEQEFGLNEFQKYLHCMEFGIKG